MNAKKSIPLWILLVIAVGQQILMGGTFPFARYVLQRIDPFVVAFMRYCIASLVLCSIAFWISRRKGSRKISRSDRKLILGLGIIIVIFNQTLYLYGQMLTTASHGGLVFATTPVFIYILATRYLGESRSLKRGLGIGLAVIGAVVMVFENGLEFNRDILLGDLIILGAVVAWGFYSVFGKPLVEKYGAFRITAYTIGCGSLIYFPFGLYRLMVADLSNLDKYSWLAILYLAIVTSVIGYTIWYWLLKHMEASRASVLTNIQPIVAGILGYTFLGESITYTYIAAGVIILIGVAITQKS